MAHRLIILKSKFFFWLEWIHPVTLRHLNGHNLFRTETRKEANENVIVLKRQNKIKTLQDYLVCMYLLFLTWVIWSCFLMLVDMNYLIAISMDNTIETNHRIILYTLLQKRFLFVAFVFDINRKTTNDPFKKELHLQGFFYERKWVLIFSFSLKKSHGDKAESLNLKNQSF